MSDRSPILRDIGNYLSGRVLLILLGFATFPIMTRLLSVEQYGAVSLCLRVVLLLTVLSKCGVQYAATRFYNATESSGKQEQQRFYSTLLLGPFLTGTAVVTVYAAVLLLARNRVADPTLLRCLLVAIALVLLRTLQSLLQSLLRNEGRSRLHSAFEVTTKLLTLAALVVLMTGGRRSALATLVALSLSESVVVLIQLTMLVRRDLLVPRAVDWRLIRSSIAFGAPLIAYELSSLVLDSGDRFFVLHYLGSSSLGFYSAAYNISAYLQDTVMTPLNLAIFPIYMRLWNTSGREATQTFLSTSLSWFIVAAIPISLLSMLCSQDLIALLASSRFSEAHRLLPILVPGLMLYATHIFLNVGLVLEKRTVLMAVLVFASAVVNLALNMLLLPRIGLTGAAWATALSYLLLILALAAVNQRILPVRPDLSLISRALAAALLAFLPPTLIHTPYPALALALRAPLFVALFATLLFRFSARFRQHVRIAAVRARMSLTRERRSRQERSLSVLSLVRTEAEGSSQS